MLTGFRLETSQAKGQMHPQQRILPRLHPGSHPDLQSWSLSPTIYPFNKISFDFSEVLLKLLSFHTLSKTGWQFLPAPRCKAWGAAASRALCSCCCCSFLCAWSTETLPAVCRLASQGHRVTWGHPIFGCLLAFSASQTCPKKFDRTREQCRGM